MLEGFVFRAVLGRESLADRNRIPVDVTLERTSTTYFRGGGGRRGGGVGVYSVRAWPYKTPGGGGGGCTISTVIR